MSTESAAAIAAIEEELSPAERVLLRKRLVRIETHRTALKRFPTPAHLDQHLRPEFLQTPMLDAIDEALMRAESGEQPRCLIQTPPQEGKTSRVQSGALWMLLRHPTWRIGFASYEQGIAARSGVEIRQAIEVHGSGYRGHRRDLDREDVLGLMLDPDRAQQTNWTLADVPGQRNKRPGGVISVGIGSALTGRPLDVLIVDDPVKDAKQADSPQYREAARNWFQAVATTRLGGPRIIIVIQTRWHEGDLSGWLMDMDNAEVVPKYARLNIRALAEKDPDTGEFFDPLGREPGEYLLSARGHSAADWQGIRDDVGERWWAAMYQGNPSPLEGGVFKRAWFDKHRVAERPEMRRVVTYIDPADNTGTGDEAGVITAGLGVDDNVYLLDDASGHYTVAGWVRAALFSMLRNGGGRLAFEQSLSNLRKHIRDEWRRIRKQARTLQQLVNGGRRASSAQPWPAGVLRGVVDDAVRELADEDDTAEDILAIESQLVELWRYVPDVMRLPKEGPPVKRIIAKGSKSLRAELVSPLIENGGGRVVGHLPMMEHQMCTWLAGKESPDRMDAAVHALDDLGKQRTGRASVRREKTDPPQRLPSRRPAGSKQPAGRVPTSMRITRTVKR